MNRAAKMLTQQIVVINAPMRTKRGDAFIAFRARWRRTWLIRLRAKQIR